MSNLSTRIQSLPAELSDLILHYTLLPSSSPSPNHSFSISPLLINVQTPSLSTNPTDHRDLRTDFYARTTFEISIPNDNLDLLFRWLRSLSPSTLSKIRVIVAHRTPETLSKEEVDPEEEKKEIAKSKAVCDEMKKFCNDRLGSDIWRRFLTITPLKEDEIGTIELGCSVGECWLQAKRKHYA